MFSFIRCKLKPWLKSLVIIPIILNACVDETDDLTQPRIFTFSNFDLKGGVECFDSLGNGADTLCDLYQISDFSLTDGMLPTFYRIDLTSDSTALLYQQSEQMVFTKPGVVKLEKSGAQTIIKIYSDSETNPFLILSASLIANKLHMDAFSSIFYQWFDQGYTISNEAIEFNYGKPEIDKLINNFPRVRLNLRGPQVKNLYVQKYGLEYDQVGYAY
jgi:hypothetical protein